MFINGQWNFVFSLFIFLCISLFLYLTICCCCVPDWLKEFLCSIGIFLVSLVSSSSFVSLSWNSHFCLFWKRQRRELKRFDKYKPESLASTSHIYANRSTQSFGQQVREALGICNFIRRDFLSMKFIALGDW